MEVHKDLEVIWFKEYSSWLTWLKNNYTRQDGIWLKFAKKASKFQSLSYEEAREGALIYGWIDGLKNAYDENFYLLKFTPRRKTSAWSKINKDIANELIKDKKMMPSGLKEVEAAKKDGRWDRAYDSPSTIQIPKDFQEALDKNPNAKVIFQNLNSSNRYAFLYRLQNIKKLENRKPKIEIFIKMLEDEKFFHSQKPI